MKKNMVLKVEIKNNYKLILSLMLLLGTSAFGKYSNSGVVRGTVVDRATHAPLAYTVASLHKVQDAAPVAGSVNIIGGEFFIPNVPDGDYYLKLSGIGHKSLYISNVRISKDKREYVLENKKLRATRS